MHDYQQLRLNVNRLPATLKWTLFVILALSLFAVFSNSLFTQLFHLNNLTEYLALSSWGLRHFFIWQPLSYALTVVSATGSFSLSFLISLFFSLALLMGIGSSLIREKGERHFLAIYFGGTLFAALVAACTLPFNSTPFLLSGVLLGSQILLVSWVFLVPGASFLIFFVLPMQAKWIALGLFAFQILASFSSGAFSLCWIKLSALVFAYLYPVICWEMLSPFPRTHSFDRKTIALKRALSTRISNKFS